MKRILLATDFSRPAFVAARYACCLAEAAQARILLYHAVTVEGPGHPALEIHSRSIREHLEAESAQSARGVVKELAAAGFAKTPIEIEIESVDDRAEAINRAATEWDADLVVVGTQGAGAVASRLFGGVALRVVEQCSKPALLIPRHARFHGLREVLLATDLSDTPRELAAIRELASPHTPHIEAVHLRRTDEAEPDGGLGSVREIVSDDWSRALDDEIMELSADWLAMTVRPHGLFHRLFGKDLPLSVAFHGVAPFLALRP